MLLNIESLREDFPVTKNCIYFNYGLFGPYSKPVVEAIKSFLDECCLKGLGQQEVFAKAIREKERARKETAMLLGANPEEIVLTSRTTEGINLVVRGLEWKKGDKILISDLEYPPSMKIWDYLSQHYGVEIVKIKTGKDELIDPADVEKAVDHKLKLISLSHASFDTGTVLNAKDIGKIARENGVLYLLDGAQSVGVVDIDVKELGCNFYAFGGQKAFFAGSGVGVVYIEKEVSKNINPLIIAIPYTSTFIPGMEKIESSDIITHEEDYFPPYKFENSSLNYPGIVGLATAAKYLNDIGVKNIEKRVHKLVSFALESLEKVPTLEIIGTLDPEKRIFASFRIAGVTNAKITNFLAESNIIVRSLRRCVRACFHFINTENEIAQLVSILEKIPQSQR